MRCVVSLGLFNPEMIIFTRARMRFLTANSDLLTDAHAYDECTRLLAEGKTQQLRAFCEQVRGRDPKLFDNV